MLFLSIARENKNCIYEFSNHEFFFNFRVFALNYPLFPISQIITEFSLLFTLFNFFRWFCIFINYGVSK